MNKKQLAAIFLTVTMIFTTLLMPGTASANVTSDECDEIAKALHSFGIIDSVAELEYEKTLTRIEFAYWAANLLNYKGQAIDGYVFSDVEKEHIYFNSIALLSQIGAISYTENTAFNPDDEIELNEALKIIVSVLGYKDIAEVNGGYPGGYSKIANQKKLLSGIDIASTVNTETALKLLWNACEVDIMKAVKGNGDTNYYSDEGDTLLSSCFGIYKIEGKINKTYYTSIVDNVNAPSGTIVIGNKTLKTKDNIDEYVGCEVTCYYTEERNEKFGSIVYFNLLNEDAVEIAPEDFVSYSDNKIRYFDGDKRRTLTLEKNFIVIKNTKLVSENIADAFDFNNGTITLVSEKSGMYSTVIIKEYETWIVKNTDLRTQTIYDKLNEVRELCVEKSNYFKITDVYTGAELPLNYISPGDVLSILRSDDNEYVNVYFNEKTLTGTVEATGKTKNGSKFIEIGGIEYTINSEVKDLFNIISGDNFTFKLDKDGQIANISTNVSDGYVVGWIYEIIKDGGLSSTVRFKVFNQSGEHLELECDKKIILDGKSTVGEALYNRFIKNNSVDRQILRYKTNSEGIVTHIDTITYDPLEESINTITEQVAYDGIGTTFSKNGKFFYPRPIFSRDTVVLVVPDEEQEDYNEAMFSVTTTDYFIADIKYPISSYKINSETPYADIIVVRGEVTGVTVNDRAMLVSSVTVGKNLNENDSHIVRGLLGNQLITAACADDVDASHVGEGDVIRVSRDVTGEIRKIEVLYDYEDGAVPSWAPAINKFGNEYSVIFGYVYDKYLNHGYETDTLGNKPPDVLYISFNNDDNIDMEYPLPVTTSVMVYDKSLRNDKVYFGSIHDIIGSKYSSEGSKILLHTKWGSRLSLIVYK